MSRTTAGRRRPSKHAFWTRAKMIYGTLIVLGSVVGAGWTAHELIPTRMDLAEVHEAVIVAASKADVALDRQMEALIAAIARLEAKPNKTPEDIAQLDYWRRQLENLRKVRSGK